MSRVEAINARLLDISNEMEAISNVALEGEGSLSDEDNKQIDALNAEFDVPIGVDVDIEGNVYVVDSGAHRIRRISPDGIVHTIAGNGQAGYSDGPYLQAQFWYPTDIAVGPDGQLYVADWKNHRIRVITAE